MRYEEVQLGDRVTVSLGDFTFTGPAVGLVEGKGWAIGVVGEETIFANHDNFIRAKKKRFDFAALYEETSL